MIFDHRPLNSDFKFWWEKQPRAKGHLSTNFDFHQHWGLGGVVDGNFDPWLKTHMIFR